MVGVRMTEELQDDPPLATAIRRLVDIGLGAKGK